MTVDERKDIFSKECLSIKDFEKLYGVDYNTASKIIREIKTKIGINGQDLRISISGKIHVEDYLDWVDTKHSDRYSVKMENLEGV